MAAVIERLNLHRDLNVSIDVPEADTFSTIAALKKEFKTIGKVASENTLKSLAVDDPEVVNQVKAYVEEYAQNRSASLIGKRVLRDGSIVDNPNARYAITDTTRKGIRQHIEQAMAEGWSNEELAQKLQDSYNFSKVRANVIARTETNIADNDITMNSFKASGIKKKKWLTANDDRVDPECMQNQQQGVIGINDLFLSGDVCPPCHPNCRCTILADF